MIIQGSAQNLSRCRCFLATENLMPEETPTHRAQDRRTLRVAAIVLAAAVVVALIIWAGVQFYGEWVDSPVVDQAAPEATE